MARHLPPHLCNMFGSFIHAPHTYYLKLKWLDKVGEFWIQVTGGHFIRHVFWFYCKCTILDWVCWRCLYLIKSPVCPLLEGRMQSPVLIWKLHLAWNLADEELYYFRGSCLKNWEKEENKRRLRKEGRNDRGLVLSQELRRRKEEGKENNKQRWGDGQRKEQWKEGKNGGKKERWKRQGKDKERKKNEKKIIRRNRANMTKKRKNRRRCVSDLCLGPAS